MPPFTKSPNSNHVIYRIVWANPNNIGQNNIIMGGSTDATDQRIMNRFFNAIDSASSNLQAGLDLFERDPAQGQRKIATVEYGWDNTSRQLKQTVYEGEAFNFLYHVTDAWWGPTPCTDMAVYDRLNRALRGAAFVAGGLGKGGQTAWIPDSVRLSNDFFGYDSDRGREKTAHIEVGWNRTPACTAMSHWDNSNREGSYWPNAHSYWVARGAA